jgi:sugar phosphate isomerase/epimerase
MRVGFLTRYDEERIRFARANGLNSIELLVGPEADFLPPAMGWKERAAGVKGAYDAAGIRISAIGGFYVNHMDNDSVAAKRHYEQVHNAILLAEAMGVRVVAGFAGRLVNEPLEASLSLFKILWSEHASFAADHGVKIAFEHCPMGAFHSPFGGINCICTVAMWERCFNEVPSDALGLEWDASHLVCQCADPVANLRTWGCKVFHVHAKDAKVDRGIMGRYGIYHPGAIEHCFPGLGHSDWGAIVKELRRAGYHGDLNIEGWHDAVFRNSPEAGGPQLEDLGLVIARRHLAQYIDE